MRILHIEDSATIRAGIVYLARNDGWVIDQAADGRAGVDLFEQLHTELDAVLLDLVMPVISGEKALFMMLEIDASVPVIVSSGLVDPELRDRLSPHIFAWLIKPQAWVIVRSTIMRASLSRRRWRTCR